MYDPVLTLCSCRVQSRSTFNSSRRRQIRFKRRLDSSSRYEGRHGSAVGRAIADRSFTALLQAKENADDLKAEKAAIEKEAAELAIKTNETEVIMRKKAQTIGNIVHSSVPISETEVRCCFATW